MTSPATRPVFSLWPQVDSRRQLSSETILTWNVNQKIIWKSILIKTKRFAKLLLLISLGDRSSDEAAVYDTITATTRKCYAWLQFLRFLLYFLNSSRSPRRGCAACCCQYSVLARGLCGLRGCVSCLVINQIETHYFYLLVVLVIVIVVCVVVIVLFFSCMLYDICASSLRLWFLHFCGRWPMHAYYQCNIIYCLVSSVCDVCYLLSLCSYLFLICILSY
jgi:hypothetical protein